MHDSMKAKLSKLQERLAEIQKLLIDSETIKIWITTLCLIKSLQI